jgi:glycosyltransferase involved in cell wall biosynthesis
MHGRLGLPLGPLLNTGRPEIAYSPDFTAPRAGGAAPAVTIHDLSWLRYPDLAPHGLRSYLDRVVPESVARASIVFTISETTRNDLAELLGIDPARIVIAPNAVDARFSAAAESSVGRTLDRRLPADYLLAVGSIEPRKNYPGLLRALELATDCLPLVIAGRRGWNETEIVLAIKRAEEQGRAIWLGHVDDRDLPGLYASSRGVICVSWYEGFSLPVLEGLAAGVRVLASDIPAHREVAGEFALYTDPASPEAIADGIIRLMSAPAGWADHRLQGWLRRYDWDDSASHVWNALTRMA